MNEHLRETNLVNNEKQLVCGFRVMPKRQHVSFLLRAIVARLRCCFARL